jgi:hypothetical protein
VFVVRIFSPLLAVLTLLTACGPGDRRSVDPATLQTPAAEAVLRHVIERCPKRAEAKLAVIGIGEYLAPPTPEFVERFKDVPGLTFIAHDRVVAGMVGGKSRRFDEQTNLPVLELQIGSLTDAKEGRQEAVAAWAYMDDAERKRLEVIAKSGGGFDIRELETIPVPARNDDTRRTTGK